LGGFWPYGSNAGPFSWRLYDSSAVANGASGGRLVRKAG